MEIVASYVADTTFAEEGRKTGGDPVTWPVVGVRPVGYLISKAPGVLFVGRRGVFRGVDVMMGVVSIYQGSRGQ